MKRSILFLLMLAATSVYAQQELSAFTSTGRAGVSTTMVRDYQSIGINPANLGMIQTDDDLGKSYKFSLGLAEIGTSVHSDALQRPDLRANMFSLAAFQGGDTLTHAEKVEAGVAFADAGIQINADVMSLGFGVQPSRQAGGFAFSIRDRMVSSFKFNKDAADILFNGYNAAYFDTIQTVGVDTSGHATEPKPFSELLDGSRLGMTWYRELNLAYGRVIVDSDNFKLYGGIGGKYLMGISYLDIDITGGNLNAYSAMGPIFGIDYGTATTVNPVTDGSFLTSVGSGWGADAGLTATFGEDEKIKVGISITDIGSITWDGNVYTAKDTLFESLSDDGIDSYNIIGELDQIVGGQDFFVWEGNKSIQSALPTRLRAGLSYKMNNMLELSGDLVLAMNNTIGNNQNMLAAFGVDFSPIEWLRISSGFSYGSTYGVNVPIGVYAKAPGGAYEIGIASRDAVTFFAKNTPTLSLALGILRFKF